MNRSLIILLSLMILSCAHNEKNSPLTLNHNQMDAHLEINQNTKTARVRITGIFASNLTHSLKISPKLYQSKHLKLTCGTDSCELDIFELSESSYQLEPHQLRVDFDKSTCASLAESFHEAIYQSPDTNVELSVSRQGPCYFEFFDAEKFEDDELLALLNDFLTFKNQRDERIQFLLRGNLSVPDTKEILKLMVDIDQKARGYWFYPDQHNLSPLRKAYFKRKLWPQLLTDEAHLPILTTLLKKYDWFRISVFGAKSDEEGWLLVQHMDQAREFQIEILKILERLYPLKETSPKNYAYLSDRLSEHQHRKQKYGTQGQCVGKGIWEPWNLLDPKKVDAYRKEVGLGTMSEYKKVFLSLCP